MAHLQRGYIRVLPCSAERSPGCVCLLDEPGTVATNRVPNRLDKVFVFDDVVHCQRCCTEFPVQLFLPVIRTANGRSGCMPITLQHGDGQ